jgi:hypothetical protein
MGDVREEIKRLADATEKLTNEVERLRRDIAWLRGRIEPFEGEPPLPKAMGEYSFEFHKWTVRRSMEEIAFSRRLIVGCEAELSAMRARIDAIEGDAYLRDDLKPWLKK